MSKQMGMFLYGMQGMISNDRQVPGPAYCGIGEVSAYRQAPCLLCFLTQSSVLISAENREAQVVRGCLQPQACPVE